MRANLDPRAVQPASKAARAIDAPPSHAEPKATSAGIDTHRASTAPIAMITPALFDDEQAALYLGIGSRKFREMREAGLVPAPIVLGPRHLRWSRVELDAAIAAMPRQSTKPDEPAWLANARSERSKTSGAAA